MNTNSNQTFGTRFAQDLSAAFRGGLEDVREDLIEN